MKNFKEKLLGNWEKGQSVCVGLDTKERAEEAIVEFNRRIIESTADLVCAYKLNSAFYEAIGDEGIRALKSTISLIKSINPDIPVILDAKRGDIGSTNLAYVEFAFDFLNADAITIHPYLGEEANRPFLDRVDKGVLVLVKTSNSGAGEFQDLVMKDGEQLYQKVARRVVEVWNKNYNCGVVVGATYPKELASVREIVGEMPILVPGIGAQGGDVDEVVKAGRNKNNLGMIINSSRGIIFAADPRKATVEMADKINEALKK